MTPATSIDEDITLLSEVRTMTGQRGRLYYYKGNFYMPLNLDGAYISKVKVAIRKFKKENKELITKDRESDGYMEILEIFDKFYGGDSK